MTIKIKAPVIWLEEADLILHAFLSMRLTERERKSRIVSDSDWRKLIALVKALDTYVYTDLSEPCWDDVLWRLAELKEKP